MFDVPPIETQTLRWSGEVPLDDRPWSVGLIVGPSGSGKSTVARALFGDRLIGEYDWSGHSVLDDFPVSLPLPDLAALCQAVGFNTIPAWLRPYRVLSTGEKFRVSLARALAESDGLIVVDEFTSVVDRQVAQIGSFAVAKYVRRQTGLQFVAVSCHSDIEAWLNPDWVLEPATMTFTWRSLQRRPQLAAEVVKVDYAAWKLFAPFHYMTADLHRKAQCYCLLIKGTPAVFCGMLFRPHPTATNIWGVSRVVTLPDYQGLGLAFVLLDAMGAAFRACGQRMHNYPAHPSFIRACARSPAWRLERKPGLIARNRSKSQQFKAGSAGGRPNAVFSYCGPADPDPQSARALLAIPSLLRAR